MCTQYSTLFSCGHGHPAVLRRCRAYGRCLAKRWIEQGTIHTSALCLVCAGILSPDTASMRRDKGKRRSPGYWVPIAMDDVSDRVEALSDTDAMDISSGSDDDDVEIF